MSRRWSVLVVVLLVGSLSLAFGPRAASAVAGWLVVEDPLVSARAIVVLNGGFPFRAMEAASLYQQGWAPQVWLTRASSPAQERRCDNWAWRLTKRNLSIVRCWSACT